MLRSALITLAAGCALGAPVPAMAATAPRESALYGDGPGGRFLLDSGWTTRADPNDAGLGQSWQRPGHGAGFHRVSIPNSFNARDRTRRGFASRVQWYRVRFRRPAASGATAWRLRFESVSTGAQVFLNGRSLGRHEGAYLPFELDARGLRPGLNELVVRVDGRASRTDIPPAGRERGWWNYGGILREVYLRKVSGLDLGDPQVVAAPGDPARVRFSAMVRNGGRRSRDTSFGLEASGPNGFGTALGGNGGRVRPGRLVRVSASFDIPKAVLWSPENPALYELRVRLPGGQVTQIHFGVRQWTHDAAGRAFLNGRPLSLRGASFHEDTLAHGAALTAGEEDGLAADLQALGANFSRQHYPPSPRLLEAFDRLGIVFWEQLPVWRLRGSQLGGRLRREALSRLRQAILRDRNHAAVMTWSVGNEILRGGRNEAVYLGSAKALIRSLDPTRFFGIDKALSPVDQIPASYRTLDAFGISDYLGWYSGSSDDLRPTLDELRSRLPGVALFETEFGAEANRAGPAAAKGTLAFQSDFLDRHLSTIDGTPYVNGAIVWLLRDYAVRPGWAGGNPRPSPPLSKKGLIDERGKRKPAFDVVRRHFSAVPPTRSP